MLDRAEGALLVCDLAALTDCEVEREQSDDCVYDPARDEAGAREDLEGSCVYEPFAGLASLESR